MDETKFRVELTLAERDALIGCIHTALNPGDGTTYRLPPVRTALLKISNAQTAAEIESSLFVLARDVVGQQIADVKTDLSLTLGKIEGIMEYLKK
jgi:hypothetical protein